MPSHCQRFSVGSGRGYATARLCEQRGHEDCHSAQRGNDFRVQNPTCLRCQQGAPHDLLRVLSLKLRGSSDRETHTTGNGIHGMMRISVQQTASVS